MSATNRAAAHCLEGKPVVVWEAEILGQRYRIVAAYCATLITVIETLHQDAMGKPSWREALELEEDALKEIVFDGIIPALVEKIMNAESAIQHP